MIRKIILMAFLFISHTTIPLNAIVVLPRQESAGERFGKAFGDGFSKAMEEARIIEQQRQLREQLQMENRIASEMSYYKNVVSQLSYESAHPTLAIPPSSLSNLTHHSCIEMSDNRTMGCLFKMKLNRVLSDGTLVEWLWSLDISNQTRKRFFSFGNMEYSQARFKIELLDANNFVISSCIYYADVFLKRGKSTNLQGKWIIPYDQISNLSTYRISIGYD